MSDVQLGVLAPTTADRDATHVATVAVVAAEDLAPGEHIGLVESGSLVAGTETKQLIGIVDPFLMATVKKGERFYLCLYPRSVTGLRHVYVHPVLDPENALAKRAASERWLRDFCNEADCPGYEMVLGKAVEHAKYGGAQDDEYLHFSGQDAHGEIPPEFWSHVEVVTGIKATHRARAFSCAC